MVGYLKEDIEQAIYREYIQEMSDDRLEEEARDYNWLCETSLGGPWPIHRWKRDYVREECQRRGKGESYERARITILSQLSERFFGAAAAPEDTLNF